MSGLERQLENGLLSETLGAAKASRKRAKDETPILHQADLDEALAGPQGERMERVRAIAAGEPVDPPHRIRRVDSAGEPGDGDGFVGMGPGIDYESEARDF